jgi:hypothetical protein
MTDLFTWAEMSCFKWWLYLLGPILEGIGIVVILFPDVVPGMQRLDQWLRRHGHRIANRLRRLFRIPQVIEATGIVTATGSLTLQGRGVVLPGQTASLEEKVQFLFDWYPKINEAIAALRERFEKSEKDIVKQFEIARQDVEAWTKETIRTEIARYRGGRIGQVPRRLDNQPGDALGGELTNAISGMAR